MWASAVRELGGVFGVAVLAAVFAHGGVYGSPHAFIERFGPALWVGASLSALGILAALLAPGRTRPSDETAGSIQPALPRRRPRMSEERLPA
ncbi:MAG TPA: hypothetical protein VFU04_00715 [Solirubrobacterales bacterium]|nr:hypothetical protein [Solirubrobacterales bacterium]